jgi:RNA polymerase-binding transcription factor DksA
MPADIVDTAQAAQLAEQDSLLVRARQGSALPCRTDCQDCGEPIEPARLVVQPHAQRCLYCQGQIEERLRR